MRRIDLHIHTRATAWEENFGFDENQLLKHVDDWSLDAIAITNHNMFDLDQYNEISTLLKGQCTVLPGVEVSALGTHILLICDPSLASQLPNMCKALSQCLEDTSDTATIDELEMAFPLLDKFIVIPHYRKKPSITNENLERLTGKACALETSSQKSAIRLNKVKPWNYPFVCFTDYRFGCENADIERKRYTPSWAYVKTDSCTFAAIKNALKNGDVALSEDGTDCLELYPGITSTEGVNLILGRRSAGKTYTLKRVRSLCDADDLYYIEQGDLVSESKESTFYESLDRKFAEARIRYMSKLSTLVLVAREKGTEKSRREAVGQYLKDLKKHAETKSQHDCFSESRLFTRRELEYCNYDEEERLIQATLTLLKSNSYREEINQTIGRQRLIEFLRIATEAARTKAIKSEAIKATNRATAAVKAKLNQSAVDPYPEQKLFDIFESEAFFDAFVSLVEICWKSKEVASDNGNHFGKYHLVAERRKFNKANDVKRELRCTENLSGITSKEARDYIEELLGLESVIDITSGLFDLQIEPRDKRGSKLSGGQRTECVFLGRLAEARGKSVVLIDEPESSFDNPFLDNHIAAKIKELSESSTVFVTTHNQVLGFGLKPNKIFIASYNADIGKYQLHCGDMQDDWLIDDDGKKLPTIETLIQLFEASWDSYDERNSYYGRTHE